MNKRKAMAQQALNALAILLSLFTGVLFGGFIFVTMASLPSKGLLQLAIILGMVTTVVVTLGCCWAGGFVDRIGAGPQKRRGVVTGKRVSPALEAFIAETFVLQILCDQDDETVLLTVSKDSFDGLHIGDRVEASYKTSRSGSIVDCGGIVTAVTA